MSPGSVATIDPLRIEPPGSRPDVAVRECCDAGCEAGRMGRGRRSGVEQPTGPAAALAAAMVADRIDLIDPAAIDDWMNEFNALSYDERGAVLGDDIINAVFAVPVVELPDEDRACSSATQSPLLVQARLLVDFVGEGRKLTQTGNLTLADARQLVSLLDTGDRFDETIGDRTFKTTSAAELPQLSFIVRLATKASFVRSVKGRLVSTKAGRCLGRDPLADLSRLVGAIDDLGLVTARTAGGRYAWTALAPFFDDLFVPLTVLLLSTPDTVAFDEIVERAFEQFEEEIDFDNPHWDHTRRHHFVESEIGVAIGTLEAAGIATWHSELETSQHGTTKRTRGTVALTPAGRWTLHRRLTEAHDIPLQIARPAEFTEDDFDALITACETAAPDDFGHVMREITAWLEHRGDHAMSELTLAARTTPDPAARNIALAVLGERFGPAAEPHVRSLLDIPTTRGAALLWLVDHEREPADVLLDPDPAVFVDVLALTLVSRGPADMTDVFEHVGDHDAQLALVRQIWRQPSPAVGPVLDTLGRHHPTTSIAKAARKAAMQHASHEANQPG